MNWIERQNKKVLIISNGLDIKLKIGEKWGPIFIDKNEKFYFYFIKLILNEEENNIIKNIWNYFKEKTKTELATPTPDEVLYANALSFSSYWELNQL